MIKYFFVAAFIIFFAGCASKVPSRTVENYYSPTGVDKYFLNDIPSWANFDQKAGCFRGATIRYFNIDGLMKSYNLSFDQAIQIQASFNEELTKLKQSSKTISLNLKDEEMLFYKVNEKVTSKIIFFDPPTYQRVNLIWLDEIVGDVKKEKKLEAFIASAANDAGVPVLVSFCMTRDEVEKKYPALNTKMITAELFSVYNKDGSVSPGFKFELEPFFKLSQKIYFYSQKSLVPTDVIKGTLKILNY